jgi:hypothetical protein
MNVAVVTQSLNTLVPSIPLVRPPQALLVRIALPNLRPDPYQLDIGTANMDLRGLLGQLRRPCLIMSSRLPAVVMTPATMDEMFGSTSRINELIVHIWVLRKGRVLRQGIHFPTFLVNRKALTCLRWMPRGDNNDGLAKTPSPNNPHHLNHRRL